MYKKDSHGWAMTNFSTKDIRYKLKIFKLDLEKLERWKA